MFNMDFRFPRVALDKSDHIEAVRNAEGKMVFVKYPKSTEQSGTPDAQALR